MKSFKVALLQIMPGRTTEENLKIGIKACRQAKEMGADIALFPEMWSAGYEISGSAEEVKDCAVAADGEFVGAFGELAKELNMAIAVTYLERHEPMPRNTVTIFNRLGERILDYAKVHTCDFGDECKLYPGEDFYAADLDTGHGTCLLYTSYTMIADCLLSRLPQWWASLRRRLGRLLTALKRTARF